MSHILNSWYDISNITNTVQYLQFSCGSQSWNLTELKTFNWQLRNNKYLLVMSQWCRTNLQDGTPPLGAAAQRGGRGAHPHQHGVAVDTNSVGAVVVVRKASTKLWTFPTNHLEPTNCQSRVCRFWGHYKCTQILYCSKSSNTDWKYFT